MWALPTLHQMPLQLQWSGACLVLLMLGWPLAVLRHCWPWALSPGCSLAPSLERARPRLALTVLAPAWCPPRWRSAGGHCCGAFWAPKVFVYLFGRGFFGTVVCLFIGRGCWPRPPASDCRCAARAGQGCPLADGLGRCGGRRGMLHSRLCGLPPAVVGHLVGRFVTVPAAEEIKFNSSLRLKNKQIYASIALNLFIYQRKQLFLR